MKKGPATVQFLREALRRHFLLKFLPDADAVLDKLQCVAFLPGDVIVFQVSGSVSE